MSIGLCTSTARPLASTLTTQQHPLAGSGESPNRRSQPANLEPSGPGPTRWNSGADGHSPDGSKGVWTTMSRRPGSRAWHVVAVSRIPRHEEAG